MMKKVFLILGVLVSLVLIGCPSSDGGGDNTPPPPPTPTEDEVAFEKHYLNHNTFQTVCEGIDSGYVAIEENIDPFSDEFSFVKLDSKGEVISQNPITYDISGVSIKKVAESHYVGTRVFGTGIIANYNDIPLLFFDRDGNITDDVRFELEGCVNWTSNFIETADNGFLLFTGERVATEGKDYIDYTYFVKTDRDGNKEWDLRLETGYIYTIIQGSDGNYYAGGYTQEEESAFLLQILADGSEGFTKNYNELYGVDSIVNSGNDDGIVIFSAGPYESKILNVNYSGDTNWTKNLEFMPSDAIDNGYDGYTFIKTSMFSNSLFIEEINYDGNSQWEQLVTADFNMASPVELRKTSDGYFVSGESASDGKPFIIKYNIIEE